MKKDNAIITLQVQVRKLTIELEQVRGFVRRAPHRWEFDHNLVDIAYSSSHKDHEEQGVKWRGPFKMILMTSRLSHWSLMVTSNQRTTSIGFKPLRGLLSS